MERFLPSLLTISVALGLGFLLRLLFEHFVRDPELLPRLRVHAQKLSLLVLNPVAFLGALWILPLQQGSLALLPVVGILGLAAGFAIGLIAMRIRPLPPAQAIGFCTSCSFVNTGNLGSLIVYLLLGELAFALVPLYRLLEEFWSYGVLFPYTRQQALKAGLIKEPGIPMNAFLRVVTDPFFLIAGGSIVIGLALNLAGFKRPEVYAEVNSWLIPASSFLLLTAIGTQIRVGRIPQYWKPALAITVLRMSLLPLIAFGLALLFGFGSDPTTLKTIVILGAMPMAFISLVPASLYNLDADLISTAWIFSTASVLVSVPILLFVLA